MLVLVSVLPVILLLMAIRRQLWKRSQLNIAAWPASLQYYALKRRVKLVFVNAGWTVENLGLGNVADFKMKKEGYQLIVKCTPIDVHIGSAKIRDLGFYKFTVAGQSTFMCIMSGAPDVVCVDEAAQRNVFLTHYTDLEDMLHIPVSSLSRRFDAIKKDAAVRVEALLNAPSTTIRKGHATIAMGFDD